MTEHPFGDYIPEAPKENRLVHGPNSVIALATENDVLREKLADAKRGGTLPMHREPDDTYSEDVIVDLEKLKDLVDFLVETGHKRALLSTATDFPLVIQSPLDDEGGVNPDLTVGLVAPRKQDYEPGSDKFFEESVFMPTSEFIGRYEDSDAETCDVVKQDGDVCGRDRPCQYHDNRGDQ